MFLPVRSASQDYSASRASRGTSTRPLAAALLHSPRRSTVFIVNLASTVENEASRRLTTVPPLDAGKVGHPKPYFRNPISVMNGRPSASTSAAWCLENSGGPARSLETDGAEFFLHVGLLDDFRGRRCRARRGRPRALRGGP